MKYYTLVEINKWRDMQSYRTLYKRISLHPSRKEVVIMSKLKNKYTVSAVVGDYRRWEYGIEAYTEKQACYLFSAPYSKGGRGNGYRVFDIEVHKEPSAQLELSFD